MYFFKNVGHDIKGETKKRLVNFVQSIFLVRMALWPLYMSYSKLQQRLAKENHTYDLFVVQRICGSYLVCQLPYFEIYFNDTRLYKMSIICLIHKCI